VSELSRRAEEVLHQVLGAPADERTVRLEQDCGGDGELHALA
jgi:hypothetical protein